MSVQPWATLPLSVPNGPGGTAEWGKASSRSSYETGQHCPGLLCTILRSHWHKESLVFCTLPVTHSLLAMDPQHAPGASCLPRALWLRRHTRFLTCSRNFGPVVKSDLWLLSPLAHMLGQEMWLIPNFPKRMGKWRIGDPPRPTLSWQDRTRLSIRMNLSLWVQGPLQMRKIDRHLLWEETVFFRGVLSFWKISPHK